MELITWMDNTSVIRTLAEELTRIFPALGRQIAMHLRASGEEETTMMQINVLYHIKETKQAITTSDLAKSRKVSLQAASVVVQGMVERGWLIRVPDPADRRRSLLQVTPEGVAQTEATYSQIIDFLADFLGDLSTDEVAAAQIFLPAFNRILAGRMAMGDSAIAAETDNPDS